MFSEFYILHKKNPTGAEVLPEQVPFVFKTCLRLMGFAWLSEGETLKVSKEYEVFHGEKAYRFLVEVICGLHSPVIGETEVFGQFKTFLQCNNIDHPLATILSYAVIDTKKIRAQYLRDLGGQSYGSLVRKKISRPAEVHLIGSGAFVGDLLPWIYKDENQVLVHARNVQKAEDQWKTRYSKIQCVSLDSQKITSGMVIIAAPISAQQIEALIENKDLTVIDLRGESREDGCHGFKNYHTLAQFFATIEKNQQHLSSVKDATLTAIQQFSQGRMLVESFRPFGWDDICVW
jgi:glutamyl-tRNA reductase